MDEMLELAKDIFGDVVASGICRTTAPTMRFCRPYIGALGYKIRASFKTLRGDFKAVIDNPFGLLWLLTAFGLLALAGWVEIHSVTAPTEVAVPLSVVCGGFVFYFVGCGVKALAVRVKVKISN